MLTEAWEATVCGLAVGQAQGLHLTSKDRYREAARSTGRDLLTEIWARSTGRDPWQHEQHWQQMVTATGSDSFAPIARLPKVAREVATAIERAAGAAQRLRSIRLGRCDRRRCGQ